VTLPPHQLLDPEKTPLPDTLPPVTRFDRQAFMPPPVPTFDPSSPPFVPQATSGRNPMGSSIDAMNPRPATTGITSPAAETFDLEENGPRNRFFLQNQYGSTSPGFGGLPAGQMPTTGIRSSASPSLNNGGGPLLSNTELQYRPAGFLPPDARGSFGPRIGPTASLPKSTEESPSTPPRRTPLNGSPILTMAIPGTTLIYGAGADSPLQRNQLAPALSDPNYTPFVRRPTIIKPALPDLPPLVQP